MARTTKFFMGVFYLSIGIFLVSLVGFVVFWIMDWPSFGWLVAMVGTYASCSASYVVLDKRFETGRFWR